MIESDEAAPTRGQYVYELSTHRQHFVDDYLVAETHGLHKRLHQPVKHVGNPILEGEGDEGEYIVLHGSVIWDADDELHKIWYMARGGYRYATSRDGLHWEKPDLGIFPDGGRPNNVVFRGPFPEAYVARHVGVQGISVILDSQCEDPQERYKLFTFCVAFPGAPPAIERECAYGYYTATSPDGLHWQCRRDAVLTKERDDPLMSDCNTCAYDPLGKRFMAFTKRHVLRGDGIGDQDTIQRARGLSFSPDFRQWSRPVTCLMPDDGDARDLNMYRQTGWVYEGMYLGLIECYYSSHKNRTMPMCRDVQLVSSRDGEHWFRAGGRETFLPIGGGGAWDAYMLDTPSNGPFLKGDELWFYYGGRRKHHNYLEGVFKAEDDEERAAIGLAVLRRDGFVSYDTGPGAGTLLTKPFRFEQARTLHLNADTAKGQVQVEVVSVCEDEDIAKRSTLRDWAIQYGEAHPEFGTTDSVPCGADDTDHRVVWCRGQDLSRLAGRMVALRFHLTDASLFSWWID